jgi:hypothetical protein
MLVITSGLLLLVFGEVQFHTLGFICVMSAAALSGLRWTLTQIMLQDGGEDRRLEYESTLHRSTPSSPSRNNNINGTYHTHRRLKSHNVVAPGVSTTGVASPSSPLTPVVAHALTARERGPIAVVGSLTPVMGLTVLLFSLAVENVVDVLTESPWCRGTKKKKNASGRP